MRDRLPAALPLAALPFVAFALAPALCGADERGAADVFDRRLPVGEGRPAIVLYTNRGTVDALRQDAFRLLFRLRERLPVVVVRVDLRDVPRLFHGIAREQARSCHRDLVAEMRERYRRAGLEPPPDLDRSLYFVADAKGEPHRTLGLEPRFRAARVRALDGAGRELARGPFPAAGEAVARALEADALLAPPRPETASAPGTPTDG